MRLSHLNGWRALEAVLRLGTVAAAAGELGVTQAAVGAQIRALEARLDRTLFRRAPGGLEPLDAARAVADRLTAGLSTVAEVEAALSAREARGHVALTVTHVFAETWLPRHLPDLFARQSRIDLRLDTTWEVVDLRRSDMHFAIRFMGPPEPDHAAVDLMPSGVVPVCTPEFAARHGLGPDTRSLAEVPVVRIDVPTTDPDWADWDAWSRITGIAVGGMDSARQFAFSGSGVRIARAGAGLVLGGLSDALYGVADGSLVMPFGPASVVPARYWHRLIWLKERRLGPEQRAVRDWIAEHAAEDRATMKTLFGV